MRPQNFQQLGWETSDHTGRTLAYGTKYGIGVFCLLETGEQQIGWVPDDDKNTLNFVERRVCYSVFKYELIEQVAKK